MSTPCVSIGLPVYNGANYVAEAIESVQAQTFGDFELVISDNGSTDATEDICRELAAGDSRIRYHRADTNGGAPWNFNRAVELSSGEYFKWLAHDDVIAPTYLARTVEVLRRDSEVVLCHARTGIIDSQGELVVDPASPAVWELQGISPDVERRRLARVRSPRPQERFLGVLLDSIRCHEVFGLVRRRAMNKTGRHHAYCSGEKVYLAEMSLLGRFHEVPEMLSFSRWHAERFSSNASAREQFAHMNPGAGRRRWSLPRQVRSTCGYFEAVARGQLGLVERAGCLAALARFVLRPAKWRSIAVDYARGVGQLAQIPDSLHEVAGRARPHCAALAETCEKGA